jgi:hypothetical protein
MKLKTRTIYINYDFPIVFSATNEKGNYFVCLFTGETDTYLKYFCREISSFILADLEDNRRDIRSIFENPGKLYSLCLNAQSEEPVEAIETTEDVTPFLPEKDLFIGVHERITPQTVKYFQDGLLEGEMIGIEKTARNALAKGMSIELIHDITGLEIETIEQLAAS